MLRLLLRPGGAMARSFLKYATPVLVNEVLWGLGVSVMTAVMGHMAISTDMLAAHAIMGNIDKFSTVACFGIAGATAVIVASGSVRARPGGGLLSGCCLLTVSFGVGLVVSVCLAVLLLRCSSPISILCSIWRGWRWRSPSPCASYISSCCR